MTGDITIPVWFGMVILISIPLIGLATRTWLVSRIEGAVKTGFEKQLETHKNELLLTAEAARFDYQRKIQDFELFTTKKHIANAKLYRGLLEAHGRVTDLLPKSIQYAPSFEDFNEKDLEAFLGEQKFPSAKQEEVLRIFRDDKGRAVEAYLEYRATLQSWKAHKAHERATRYFVFNALYLSPRTTELAEKLLLAMRGALIDIQLEGAENVSAALASMRQVTTDLKDLRQEMQRELTAGYYSSGRTEIQTPTDADQTVT